MPSSPSANVANWSGAWVKSVRNAVVVDDACLRSILLDDESRGLKSAIRNKSVFTTNTWLYRLAQVVRNPNVRGVLSGPIAALAPDLQDGVIGKLIDLPPEIGLLTGRDLAWSMAGLVLRHRLNYLSLEALASAVILRAPLVLATEATSPLLVDACRIEQVRVILAK